MFQITSVLWILLGTIYIGEFYTSAVKLSGTNYNTNKRSIYVDYENSEEVLSERTFPSDFNYVTPDNNLLDLNASAYALPEPAALAAPERSIYDSGYTKTANFIMNTALKLPPHILPTLEELDGSKVSEEATHKSHVGVYLPDKRQNVGLYLPVPKSTKNRNKVERTKNKIKRNRNKKLRARQRQLAQKQYQKRIEEQLSINSRISNEVTTERNRQLQLNKAKNKAISNSLRPRRRKNTKKRAKNKSSIIPKNSLAGRLFKFGQQNAKAFTRRHQSQTASSLRREPTFHPKRWKYTKRPWKPGQKPPYGHTPNFPPLSLQKDYLALRENPEVQEKSSNPPRIEPKENHYAYGGHPYSFEPADFRLPWNNYDTTVTKSIEDTRNGYLDFDDDGNEGSYNVDYNKGTGPRVVAYSAEDYNSPNPNYNQVTSNYEDVVYGSNVKPKRQISTPIVNRPGKLKSHRSQKRKRPYNHINMDTGISRYVPKMVKTVLAKSFLKNPRPYLIRLEEDNSKKDNTKRKKRRKRKHQNKFLTRRYTTTTQAYSDFKNSEIDRMDGNQDHSRIPVSDENISLFNGLSVNNQIADPFDLYDDVVSKEYEVPTIEDRAPTRFPTKNSDNHRTPTTEPTKFFEFEKITYPKPGYETHKNTHEESIAIINDKIDKFQVEGPERPDNFYKELLHLYEQDRTRPNHRLTSTKSSDTTVAQQHLEDKKFTIQGTPFTKDSKPFIDYLQRLSILSGEDYYDDGKTEIDLDSENETTLCFCCSKHFKKDYHDRRNTEEDSYHFNRFPLVKKRSREKRAIRIPDPLKSKLVYENIDILEQSLDCHHQEPIIVKISSRYLDKNHPISRLSFNRGSNIEDTKKRNLNHREEKKDIYYVPTKRKSGRYLKPQTHKIGLQYSSSQMSPTITFSENHEKGPHEHIDKSYYDPKKLSFTFTTPSSIARRYLRYRDKDIVTQKSSSVNERDNSKSFMTPYKDSVTQITNYKLESRLINDDYHNNIYNLDLYDDNKDTVSPSTKEMNNLSSPSLTGLSNIKKSKYKGTTVLNYATTQSPTEVTTNKQSTRKELRIDPLGLSIFRLLRG